MLRCRSRWVDYISVMVGNNNRYESRVRHWPPSPAHPGLFRGEARVITEVVTKPVAAVGRILTLALANDLIEAGDADLVGMVRAHIAEPKLIPLSNAGRAGDVRPCVGINHCTNGLLDRKPLCCAVNPDVADSADAEDPGALSGSRAVVVGSGPAGLEAARRLAVRGASVTLFEASPDLGGRLAQWGKAPSRRDAGHRTHPCRPGRGRHVLLPDAADHCRRRRRDRGAGPAHRYWPWPRPSRGHLRRAGPVNRR